MKKIPVFRYFISAVLITLLCLVCLPTVVIAQPVPREIMGVPVLSDAEYKTMSSTDRQEYELQLMQQIEQQVEQMSPAEIEAHFQKAYQSLSSEQQKEIDRISKMSEQEQEKYLENWFEQLDKKPKPEPAPEPEPTPTPEPKEKEVVVKVSEKEKAVKEALKLINEVITAIDTLLVKIAAKQDFVYKLTKWGKKRKIKQWNGGFKWDVLRKKIHVFREQLDRLKDRDPKTKKHKYLHNFVANENLYNKLYNFSVDLADYVPAVRVEKGKPLAKRIRKKSNKALRSLVDALVELLFDTKPKKDKKQPETMVTALEQLFTQYDPEAEKIKKEEAEKAKKALGPTERRPFPDFGFMDGSQEGESPFFYDDYEGYVGSDHSRRYQRKIPSGSVRRRTRRGSGATKPKPRKPKKPTKKPTDDKVAPKEKKEFKKDRALNRFVRSLEAALTVVVDLMDEHPKLKDLHAYVKAKKLDKALAESHIPDVHRNLTKATSKLESIEGRLESKELSTVTKKGYISEVKAFIKESKEDIENLAKNLENIEKVIGKPATQPKRVKEIRKLEQDIKALKQELVNLPAGRGKDIFQQNIKANEQKLRQLKQQPPQKALEMATLVKLRESAQEFLKKATEFEKKKG